MAKYIVPLHNPSYACATALAVASQVVLGLTPYLTFPSLPK